MNIMNQWSIAVLSVNVYKCQRRSNPQMYFLNKDVSRCSGADGRKGVEWSTQSNSKIFNSNVSKYFVPQTELTCQYYYILTCCCPSMSKIIIEAAGGGRKRKSVSKTKMKITKRFQWIQLITYFCRDSPGKRDERGDKSEWVVLEGDANGWI